MSINDITAENNYWYAVSFLSQFFNLKKLDGTEFIELEADEIILKRYGQVQTNKCSIAFILNGRDGYLSLKIKGIDTGSSEISGFMQVIFNIKNRVLRPADRNIFGITAGDTFALNLQQNSGTVKLVGTVQGYSAAQNELQFYSEIIENYFNIGSSSTFINTTGITSSSGKAVKFLIKLIESNIYILALAYQDDSTIQAGDTITFNLTPDKNSLLNPIYQDAANVQQGIEVLSKRTQRDYLYQQIVETTKKGNGDKRIYSINTASWWTGNLDSGNYGTNNYCQLPDTLKNQIEYIYDLRITLIDNWNRNIKLQDNKIIFSGGVGYAFIGSDFEVSDYTKNKLIFYYDNITNRIYFKTEEGVQFSIYITNIYMEFTLTSDITQ